MRQIGVDDWVAPKTGRRARIARRAALALGTLIVLAAVGAFLGARRASSIVAGLLGKWGSAAVAEASDSVYGLEMGTVSFSWSLRRVTVDSMRFTTNRARNALRHQPLANLQLVFRGCQISGVHVMTLVLGKGLVARQFGCDSGVVAVVVPRRSTALANARATTSADAPAGSAPDNRGGFLVLQRSLTLPSSAPNIRIARVTFPQLEFDFRLERMRREDAVLHLERLQLQMTELDIDPTDSAAAARPLFSRTVHATADNFVAHIDSVKTARVGSLHASLTDSTLEVHSAAFGPRLGDAAYSRTSRYNKTRTQIGVARVVAVGLDFGELALGGSVHARRVELDSLSVDAYKDNRLPPNPVRPVRRTPQAWIADLNGALNVDSLLIRDATVTYRERRPDRDATGVLTFAAVHGVATNVRHTPGRQTTSDPMTLAVTARLQNAGTLSARFVVPLDAPRFDMSYEGTLGAMEAASFNTLIQEIFAIRIRHGEVERMDFGATVRDGIARGHITPRYSNLSISLTEEGSTGVLGVGGTVGNAARGIASFAANLFKIRENNPRDAESPALSGVVAHAYALHQTLPSFLWTGLREGLLAVVKN